MSILCLSSKTYLQNDKNKKKKLQVNWANIFRDYPPNKVSTSAYGTDVMKELNRIKIYITRIISMNRNSYYNTKHT